MELRQLEIFQAAAQTLNFTKAADRLGYAQSNITKQIQLLESELEVRLFDRLGKSVYLTGEGRILLEHTLRILREVNSARDAVNPAKFKGILQVGAAESICVNRLPMIFRRYGESYPEVQLQLHMESCTFLAKMLRENRIDVALALAGRIQEPDMVVHCLHEERMCLAASPMHPMAQLASITPYDFRDACLIITAEGCGYRPLILSMLAHYETEPQRFMELTSIGAIKACVVGGMGVAILPYISVQEEILRGELVEIPMDFETFTVYSQLFYHRSKWIHPALERFIRACQGKGRA